MKISRFIAVSTLSVACSLADAFGIASFSYQTSSYAQKLQLPFVTAQVQTQNNSATIQAKAEEMIKHLFAKHFDKVIPLATPQLRDDLSPDKLERFLERNQSIHGNFKALKNTQVIETPGSDLVILTLEFDNITEDWIIIFNDSQEIVGVDFPTFKNVETIATEFIEDIANGEYSEARVFLHPFLKESIFSSQIQAGWEKVIAQNGDFKGIKDTSIRLGSSIDNTDIVVMDLEFSRSNEQIVVIFDSSRSIIGLDFVEQ